MAWTAPMTAVANAVFTAAQFNTHVRDNFLETAPGKATVVSSLFAGNGVNSIVERYPAQASVNTSEGTTSTSFTALTTPGPAVTVTTGTSALIIYSAEISNSAASEAGRCGVAISGATTQAVDNNHVLRVEEDAISTAIFNRASVAQLHTGLTAGSNIFTMQYASTAGGNTATFNFRNILVIPF